MLHQTQDGPGQIKWWHKVILTDTKRKRVLTQHLAVKHKITTVNRINVSNCSAPNYFWQELHLYLGIYYIYVPVG